MAYSESGVSLERAYRILDLIAKQNSKPISHFASVVKFPDGIHCRHLVFSADGVGTKIELLAKMGWDWISGWDCVAMNVNDLLCQGARPLWFLDYFSQNRLRVPVFSEVLKGMRRALSLVGADLVGGETAELPGMFVHSTSYELAGFIAGFKEERWKLSPERVKPGDLLVGLASSGPHSNGFSLIRKCLTLPEMKRRARSLLAPTTLYHPVLWPFVKRPNLILHIHSMAHITGGGFFEKLPRAMNPNCQAVLYASRWRTPSIFQYLTKRARLSLQEACGVWNMGFGFVLIVSPDGWPKFSTSLAIKAQVIGTVAARKPSQPAVVLI